MYQRNRYGIIEIIIAINVLLFFLSYIFKEVTFYGALWIGEPFDFLRRYGLPLKFTINNGAYWQLLTSVFLHGSLMHLFFNMYGLYLFGKPLEIRWGKTKFLFFYLTIGILANIASVIFLKFTNHVPIQLIGASGALMGILLAFGGYYPNTILLLFFIIPMRVKWAILLYAGVEMYFEIAGKMKGIAHFTHLFGFLFGFLYLLILFKTNPIKEMFFPDKNKYYNYQ